MILDLTRRNRRFDLLPKHYPVGKVRPEGLAAGRRTGLRSQRSAGRWPPARGGHGSEGLAQGFPGPDARRRLEDQPSNRRWIGLGYPRVVSGMDPSSSVLSWCLRAQERYLRSGGDEETRTPDPLLAKEMLCQLSYVPQPKGWWAFLDSNQRPLPYQGSALTS